MEYQNTDQSLFTLRINENMKTQLRGTAVVAGIAAILSLVSTIVSFVVTIMNRGKTKIEYNYEGFNQPTVSAESSSNLVGSIFGLIITILLFYFLNRFASQTKAGLNASNHEVVNNGLSGLSAYSVTIGILLIIFLALAILGIALVGSR